jgi:hypothetical protein
MVGQLFAVLHCIHGVWMLSSDDVAAGHVSTQLLNASPMLGEMSRAYHSLRCTVVQLKGSFGQAACTWWGLSSVFLSTSRGCTVSLGFISNFWKLFQPLSPHPLECLDSVLDSNVLSKHMCINKTRWCGLRLLQARCEQL